MLPATATDPALPGAFSANFTNGVYYPVSRFFFNRFGEKVYKVSVSVAETCPNREGKNGMETCIFCDAWGSASYHMRRDLPLTEQIRVNREVIRRRYRAQKFLVYLQSYTNTFVKADLLRERLNAAIAEQDVVGLIIGTRPDCIALGTLKVFAELAQKTYVHVELGVQSFDDAKLSYMKRGHSAAVIPKAVARLRQIDGIDIGIHLIFGFPDESPDYIAHAAQLTNDLHPDTVKLHNLHVLKHTTLHRYYLDGQFAPDPLETYADKVITFLERLHPSIAVNRLAAVANRHDELVAPAWNREKMRPTQFIIERMKTRNTCQGIRCCV